MALFINWFPVEGVSESERVYVREFSSFEASQALINDLRNTQRSFRRRRLEDDQVQLALMGTERNEAGWSLVTVSLREWPNLASALLEFAFTDWLRNRGLNVRYHRISGLHITKPNTTDGSNLLSISPSVVAKAFVNPASASYGFTLNWQVEERFSVSLADPRLLGLCLGKSLVRFSDYGDHGVEQLRGNKYLGYGLRLEGQSIVATSRDGGESVIPLDQVTLEANSENKRAVRETLSKSEQYSSFRRAQQMSFTLTPSGQRNAEVFKLRIQAIRSFLADDSASEVSFGLPTPEKREVTLSLKPMRIGR